jgi:hypothetical protein
MGLARSVTIRHPGRGGVPSVTEGEGGHIRSGDRFLIR